MKEVARLAFAATLMAALAGCASGPAGIAATSEGSGRVALAPCPGRPSCVVSGAEEARHAIEPLRYDGPEATAMARLAAILQAMPRMRIVRSDARYLHATQTSRWMRYTDDIEFLFDPQAKRIEVRSCARVGYYDFDVNRDRIEAIRARFAPPEN